MSPRTDKYYEDLQGDVVSLHSAEGLFPRPRSDFENDLIILMRFLAPRVFSCSHLRIVHYTRQNIQAGCRTTRKRLLLSGEQAHESPHFKNGLISALFGPST